MDAAIRAIGSTVEGAANTSAALELAGRAGVDLPSARLVQFALAGRFPGGAAPARIGQVFAAALDLQPAPTDPGAATAG